MADSRLRSIILAIFRRFRIVKQAEAIFKEANRPDPNWPLDRRAEKHTKLSNEAWEVKRKRDKEGWVPPNAVKQ
jgi:hypothetical protein